MSKKDLSYFIFILLCKRERRKQILYQWHIKKPFNSQNLIEIWTNFIDIILHDKIQILMTETSISFWNGKLEIPYIWLTHEEKQYIINMYISKVKIFKMREKYEANKFKYTQCTLTGTLYSIYKLQHRRELIRDFAIICKNYRWQLIKCCQCIIIKKEKKADRFIYELHNQLQLDGNIENIPVL